MEITIIELLLILLIAMFIIPAGKKLIGLFWAIVWGIKNDRV